MIKRMFLAVAIFLSLNACADEWKTCSVYNALLSDRDAAIEFGKKEKLIYFTKGETAAISIYLDGKQFALTELLPTGRRSLNSGEVFQGYRDRSGSMIVQEFENSSGLWVRLVGSGDVQLLSRCLPAIFPSDPQVLFNFANLFLDGKDAKQDYARAATLMKRASDVGYMDAHRTLARLYWNGQGVPLNYQEAMRLYKIVALSGDPLFQEFVGNVYYQGKNVERNYDEAKRWFKMGVENGSKLSSSMLYAMNYFGHGVPKDLTKALMWSLVSQSLGEDNVGSELLKKEMNSEQIENAKRLANDCISKRLKGCD